MGEQRFLFGLLSRRGAAIAGLVSVLVVGWCLAYEPVTRRFVATDAACSFCHLPREYRHTARMPFSSPHPAQATAGKEPARCVDCHLPKGFWVTTAVFTHFASITDLYGHFRDRRAERAGDWIPLSAARAVRVRDRLFEADSGTCRVCHLEAEIKPKRLRGQRAHADAFAKKETCIECHSNLVHRFVEVRGSAPAAAAGEDELESEQPPGAADESAEDDTFELEAL